MRLTKALISKVYRDMDDPGPVPDVAHMDDEDYARTVAFLARQHLTNEPLRVFAYGSLMWDPEYEVVDHEIGTAYGWHRAFAMRMERYRGTIDRPGLMMGLERGGCCRGQVHTVAPGDFFGSLNALVRRELITKPCTYSARWLTVRTSRGDVQAISFVLDPHGHFYEGQLCPNTTARRIAHATGHIGTNAEYLMNTVAHLEWMGIPDRNLEHLDHLVAQEIQQSYD